jgi:hypothetical protein
MRPQTQKSFNAVSKFPPSAVVILHRALFFFGRGARDRFSGFADSASNWNWTREETVNELGINMKCNVSRHSAQEREVKMWAMSAHSWRMRQQKSMQHINVDDVIPVSDEDARVHKSPQKW